MFANVRSSGVEASLLTNPVRQPAIKKGFIGWPPLGEAKIALALERLECAQKYRLAAGFAVHIPKPVDPDELLRVVRRLTA